MAVERLSLFLDSKSAGFTKGLGEAARAAQVLEKRIQSLTGTVERNAGALKASSNASVSAGLERIASLLEKIGAKALKATPVEGFKRAGKVIDETAKKYDNFAKKAVAASKEAAKAQTDAAQTVRQAARVEEQSLAEAVAAYRRISKTRRDNQSELEGIKARESAAIKGAAKVEEQSLAEAVAASRRVFKVRRDNQSQLEGIKAREAAAIRGAAKVEQQALREGELASKRVFKVRRDNQRDLERLKAREAKAIKDAAKAATDAEKRKSVNPLISLEKGLTGAVGRIKNQIIGLRALFAGIVAGTIIAAPIVKTAQAAGDFESSLAKISTVLDEGGVSIERYRNQLMRLSEVSPQGLTDLSQSLFKILGSGIAPTEGAAGAFSTLEAAQKAATAGFATTEQAANGLISVLNAYRSTGVNAMEASDKLFTAVRRGRIEFAELASTIGNVVGPASSFGVSLDELLGSASALSLVLPGTEEVMTSLNGIISSIINPSQKAAEAAKKLGIDFDATALKTKGLTGVLDDVRNAAGLDAEALRFLFDDIRARRGAVVLLGSGFENLVKFTKEVATETGALDSAYNKIAPTLNNIGNLFKARVELVMVRIGEKAIPELKARITELGDFIVNNQDKLASLFNVALSAVIGLVSFLVRNAKAVQNFFVILIGLKTLAGIVALIAALQKLTASFVGAGVAAGAAGAQAAAGVAAMGGAATVAATTSRLGGVFMTILKSASIIGILVTVGIELGKLLARAFVDGTIEEEEENQRRIAENLANLTERGAKTDASRREALAGRRVLFGDINTPSLQESGGIGQGERADFVQAIREKGLKATAKAVKAQEDFIVDQLDRVLQPAAQLAGDRLRVAKATLDAARVDSKFDEDRAPVRIGQGRAAGQFVKSAERINAEEAAKANLATLEAELEVQRQIFETTKADADAAAEGAVNIRKRFEAAKKQIDLEDRKTKLPGGADGEAKRLIDLNAILNRLRQQRIDADEAAFKAEQEREQNAFQVRAAQIEAGAKVTADRIEEGIRKVTNAAQAQLDILGEFGASADVVLEKEIELAEIAAIGQSRLRDEFAKTADARLKLIDDQVNAATKALRVEETLVNQQLEQDLARVDQDVAKSHAADLKKAKNAAEVRKVQKDIDEAAAADRIALEEAAAAKIAEIRDRLGLTRSGAAGERGDIIREQTAAEAAAAEAAAQAKALKEKLERLLGNDPEASTFGKIVGFIGGSLIDAAGKFGIELKDKTKVAILDGTQALLEGAIAAGQAFLGFVEESASRFVDAIVGPLSDILGAPLGLLSGGISGATAAITSTDRLPTAIRAQRRDAAREARLQVRNALPEGVGSPGEEALAAVASSRRVSKELAEGSPENVLRRAIESSLELAQAIITQAPTVLPKLFAAIQEAIPKIIALAAQAFATILKTVAPLIGPLLVTIIKALVKALPVVIDALVAAIPTIVRGFLDALIVLVDALPGALQAILKGLIELLPELFAAIGEKIGPLIASLAAAIPEMISTIFEAIPQILEELIAGIPQIVFGIIAALPQIIDGFIRQIPRLFVAIGPLFVVKLVKAVIDAQARALQDAFAKLADISLEEIGDGLKRAFDDILQAIKDFLNGIGGDTKDALIGKDSAIGSAKRLVKGDGSLSDVGNVLTLGASRAFGFHTGGMVRDHHRNPAVASAMAAAGAARYAIGGMVPSPGAMARRLAGDEVPAVLKAGEGVLTALGVRSVGGESALAAHNRGQGVSGTGQGLVAEVTIHGRPGVPTQFLEQLVERVAVSIRQPTGPVRREMDRIASPAPPGAKGVRGR